MLTAQTPARKLREILPGAVLETTSLPTTPPLHLRLLNSDYPQGELADEARLRAMNNPLYWVFCWASGQVLADFLLRRPEWVSRKRVLDFGCGSGVAAVAAALAGAAEVIACDTDPMALAATRSNADLNNVNLQLTDDFFNVAGSLDLIIVADVLYDQANFVWLERFLARSSRVLVADSRIRDFNFPNYRAIARRQSTTLPDLDESAEFGDVRIYLGEMPSA